MQDSLTNYIIAEVLESAFMMHSGEIYCAVVNAFFYHYAIPNFIVMENHSCQ